jgi:hypothetical protein
MYKLYKAGIVKTVFLVSGATEIRSFYLGWDRTAGLRIKPMKRLKLKKMTTSGYVQ